MGTHFGRKFGEGERQHPYAAASRRKCEGLLMKSNDSTFQQRHERGGGAAVPDETTLRERAQELAEIEGREEPNEKDFSEARIELLTIGSAPAAPEAGELENLTAWDTPLTAAGGQAPERAPDDEANIGEKLVEEGLEEADHDRRLSVSEVMREEET